MSYASNHTVTDLMTEADSYHRFWIEERAKRQVLREALKRIAAIENKEFGPDWEEIEEARAIARAALSTDMG